MRTVALLVAMTLAPLAGALALPTGGPAPSPEEGDPASPDGARLVVVLVNGDAAGEAQGTLRVGRGGEVLLDERVRVPAQANLTFDLATRPGAHEVVFETEAGRSAQGFSTSGCEGEYRVAMRVGGAHGPSDGARSGCVGLPPDGQAMAREAGEAMAREPGGGRASIPVPRAGDVGARLTWGDLATPDWDEAWSSWFEWAPGKEFPDQWGRLRRGAELHSWQQSASQCSAGGQVASDALRPPRAEAYRSLLRYGGDPTRPVSQAGPGCTASTSLGGQGAYTRTIDYQELRYGAPSPASCVFRHGLQGREVREGDRIEARAFCAAIGPPDGVWVVGAPAERHGLPALPLLLVARAAEGTTVARAWLADGVAYPIELDVIEVPAGGGAERAAFRLTGLSTGGEELRFDEPAPADALVETAPVDALRGPAEGRGLPRARMPFPLREAVDAARADPALDDLRRLLARPDAALAGARLSLRQEADAPAALRVWHLAFAAPSMAPVHVRCEKGGVGLPLAAPPLLRCEGVSGATPAADDIGTPPDGFGKHAVPPAGATFAEAVRRWDAADPEAAGATVDFALYRAWAGEGDQAVLAAGRHQPDSLGPVDVAGAAELSYVRLSLATGETLSEVSGVSARGALGSLPTSVSRTAALAPPPERPPDAPALGPLLAGAGLVAAAGVVAAAVVFWGALKAAFAALYTRLARPRLLDAATRRAVHDLVLAEPGIHASAVRERLGKARGVGEYHLDVLVREGLLTVVATPGFKRYFVTGRHTHAEMRAVAALKDGQAERLYHAIRESPGIHMGDLADRAGISVAYASRTVARLAEAGLVDKAQVGRVVSLRARDPPR